jgi:hypothetical protein
MTRRLILFGLLGLLSAWAEAPLALLSDNLAPGGKSTLYPQGTPVIATGATYRFATEGEFATDKETLSSSKEGGVKRLFDGESWWKSQTFSQWNGGKWVTVNVDLQRDYLLGAFEVWALRDSLRDTEQAYLLVSADGEVYTQYAVAQNSEAPPVEEVDGKKNFIRHRATLAQPVRARYVQVRILKRRHQQQLSDIAIWGWPVDERTTVPYLRAGDRPTANVVLRAIQDGAALADWSVSAAALAGVKGWRVYSAAQPFTRIDAEGVTLAREVPGVVTASPLYPFTPGTTVHFAVAAVYEDGVYPVVVSSPLTFPTPWQCERFGDMLAVNHYPGGGAAVRSQAWFEFSLELLAQSPLRESRWWFMFPKEVDAFLARGIGMITWPLAGTGIKDNVAIANSRGLYSFTKGNEPELKGTPPAKYLESLRQEGARAKAMHPANTIAAPTTNLNPAALEWLEGFYAAGAKDAFDVLDLHTYCTPPEALVERMARVHAIMAKHGDAGKPIISTEFGYADPTEGKYRLSPLRKAQYLARGLILHYVLGFKRVYLYSFADIGADPYNNEHHFGLLDYDLQKKPAYHAVVNLVRQLGDTVLDGPLPGCAAPSLGYQFTTPAKAAYVAVVWHPEADCLGSFQTAADEVQIVDLFGSERRVLLDASHALTVPYGASPVFLLAAQPITMAGTTPLRAAVGDSQGAPVALTLATPQVIVAADAAQAVLPVTLLSHHAQALSCTLTVQDAAGVVLSTHAVALSAGDQRQEQVTFELHLPEATARRHYTLRLSYATALSPYSEELPLTVRRLTRVDQGVVCVQRTFEGVSQPVYVLANAQLEVAFAPHQGGRMLDLIDRASRTNQLHCDDAQPDAQGLWFSFNGSLSDAPWSAAINEAKLELRRRDEQTGAELLLRWTLAATGAALRLDLVTTNPSAQAVPAVTTVHPAYQLSGDGESDTDHLFFPTAEGEFCLPFWTDLGERELPPLTAAHWRATDTRTGLALQQRWSAGWAPPRLWFRHGWYSVQMTHTSTIAPGASGEAWLTWDLAQANNNPPGDL